MKGLILAGGKGTRLRPITSTLAKQAVPVANRPIIHYVMDNLHHAGIRDVGVVIAPETGQQIRDCLAPNPWEMKVSFLCQEQPLGLAHAVLIAREYLAEDPFVMYLGDNLIGANIDGFVRAFTESSADAAVMLRTVDDPSHYGVAVMGENGLIERFVEKPKTPISRLAIVGVYCFSPEVHDAVRAISPSHRGELEITDAIQYLHATHRRVLGHEIYSWWHDCGKKEDLLAANRAVLDMRINRDLRGAIDAESRIEGLVMIEPGARIERSSVKGPTIIGRDTRIVDSSVGPYSSIGDGCQVRSSTLENSITLVGAMLEGVHLEDSVIGEHATVRRGEARHRSRVMVGGRTESLV